MIDAVRAQLASSDPDGARLVLRRNWLRLILESHTAELERFCLDAPDPLDPHVLLIRACCRDLLGDAEGAAFLRGRGSRPASDDFVVCFTELLLAPDSSSKAALADRARTALTQSDPEDDYPSALFLLGWTEVRLRRDPVGAIALLRSAVDEARLQDRPETLRLAQSNLAFALTHAGLFQDAERALDGLPLRPIPSDWDRFEGGLPPANRGCIAYWRGDFDAAIAHLDGAVSPGGSSGDNFEALARLYLVLSLVAVGREDRYYSASVLLQGVSRKDKHGVPWDTLRRVAGAWLAHAEGNDARARDIAAGALAGGGAPVAHVLLAELYRRLDEPALAQRAMRLVPARAMPGYAQVSCLVTNAGLRASAGRGAEAHEDLDRALERATPEGILAPFLAQDPIIGDLLVAHAHRGSRHHALLATILERRARLSRTLDGMLTPRERDVLDALRSTMTADEIARHLGISYPTVKTHIRSIYRKLGVSSRRAALRAVDQGPILAPAG